VADKTPGFVALPQCTEWQEHCNQVVLSDLIGHPQFPLFLPLRDVPGLTCPLATPNNRTKAGKHHFKKGQTDAPVPLNSDFYLYTAKLPAILDFYIGYKNVDVTYLYWCESGRWVPAQPFPLTHCSKISLPTTFSKIISSYPSILSCPQASGQELRAQDDGHAGLDPPWPV
jgi:hypothetical protein